MTEFEFCRHKKQAVCGHYRHTNSLSLFKSNFIKDDYHRFQPRLETETAEPLH